MNLATNYGSHEIGQEPLFDDTPNANEKGKSDRRQS